MTDWTPGSSGTPAWTELSDQVLASAAASISVTGIASTYRRFAINAYLISGGTPGSPLVRLNNDSGNNYARQYLLGDGASAPAARATAQTGAQLVNTMGGGSACLTVWEIEKPVAGTRGRLGEMDSRMRGGNIEVGVQEYDWANTADLINRIDMIHSAATFAAGSRMILEGAP